MYRFSYAILDLLRRYKKNTRDLAEACNYPEHIIYGWSRSHGDQPNPRNLSRLARAFSKSPKEVRENHLSLLYAHLLDDCVGQGAEYLNVEVLPKAYPLVNKSWTFHPICRRSEWDFAAIKKHIWYDQSLQAAISELARPLKDKPIPSTILLPCLCR